MGGGAFTLDDDEAVILTFGVVCVGFSARFGALLRSAALEEEGGYQTSYAGWGSWGSFGRKISSILPFFRASCCEIVEGAIEVREMVGFSIDGASDDGVMRIVSSEAVWGSNSRE